MHLKKTVVKEVFSNAHTEHAVTQARHSYNWYYKTALLSCSKSSPRRKKYCYARSRPGQQDQSKPENTPPPTRSCRHPSKQVRYRKTRNMENEYAHLRVMIPAPIIAPLYVYYPLSCAGSPPFCYSLSLNSFPAQYIS